MAGIGINTTLGSVVLAMRAHHNNTDATEQPSGNERFVTQIYAMESARLFAGGNGDVALDRCDHLDALSDDLWWAYQFVLHPSQLLFLHHRLV